MSSPNPVLQAASYCLCHVPNLVQHGSKPRREIARDPGIAKALAESLRTTDEAVAYPPNQVFIGNRDPEWLAEIPRPWFRAEPRGAEPRGAFGEIIPQDAFLAFLWLADILEPPLFALTESGAEVVARHLAEQSLVPAGGVRPSDHTLPEARIRNEVASEEALPIVGGTGWRGCFRRDDRAEGRGDENLSAHVLLENLCAKASGAAALGSLLQREKIPAPEIDFVISCGEEACGDRYQRGGGGLAKAIAEMCGCTGASGMDLKNFCAAPASALVTAGALVKAGLHRRIAVVGGGSLAKLGMKSTAFLERDMPILDDCLASMAFLVGPDDGLSPMLHLEPGAVGLTPVGCSTSAEAVYRHVLLEPLGHLGLRLAEIDKFAPELHNPEIMELAGSGDVVRKNYRSIAALAVMEGAIPRSGMDAFIERVGMPGFAPTQGHVPSAVPYLGHAIRAMREGRMRRAMFLAKASLFLNRCTELYDGVSLVLEANGGSGRR